MTSPGINKPESTNEKYDDVYSRGSSFGQDLSESSVRSLLTGRVKSPLSQFLQWGSNLIGNAVNDIANILTGSGGANYEVLTGAAVERLGDIRTQITEASKDFQNLADKAEELGTKQDVILEDISAQGVVIEQAKADASKAIKDAGTVSTALEQYQSLNDTKVRSAVATAEGANKAITDLNTQFASKVEKQIKASDYLEGELAKADSSVTAVSDLVRLQNPWKWTKDWVSGASIVQTDTEMSMPAGASTDNHEHRALTKTAVPLVAGRTYRIRALGKGKGRLQIGFYRYKGGSHSSSVWPSGNTKTFDGDIDHYVDWTVDYIKEGEDGYVAALYMRDGGITLTNVSVQDISDLSLVQPQINEGFSMALKSHQALFEGQQNWNTTQEAINKLNSAMWDRQGVVNTANAKAIIALNRTDIGSSLITYLDPTVEEYQNGTARYDTPTWTTAAPHGGTEKPEIAAMIGSDRYWGVNDGSRVSKAAVERWVRVQPGVTYKYSFWAYANEPGSKILIELRDRKGELCITDSTIRSNGDTPVNTSYIGGARLLNKGWNFYEGTFKFKDGVDEARFDKIHWNHTDGTAPKFQLIASFDVSPDVPTQADVNKALMDSDKALLDLAKEIDDRSKLNTAFSKEQRRINDLVQAQLWNHQDVIEQLDIRAPKTYGRGPGEGPSEVPPFKDMRWKGNRTSHPYFDIWVGSRSTLVAMKGSWVGEYEININWTNGAIDRWTVNVTATNRVFYFYGGALGISKRYITSTVFPRSLCRKVLVYTDKGTSSEPDVYDPEGLVRKVSGKTFRLKNRAICSTKVYYKDEQDKVITVAAGTVIPSGVAIWTDGEYAELAEVDDPGKGEYVVNQVIPPSNSNVTQHRA